MFVQLGKRSVPEDVVELLHECHGRIRRFLVMARRLALATDISRAEIVETAAQIRRYFSEAFPLHVADEELDIAPRVAGAIATDVAARMHAEHRLQTSAIADLLVHCAALERQPEHHDTIAARLAPLTARLATDLESHMELEERTVFPALRALPQVERDSILVAMRHRRSSSLSALS